MVAIPTEGHRRRRGALSATFLIVTLALAGALAYHAQDAARSHRLTAESTLRDYAGVAAWEFGRRSREALSGSIWSALTPVRNLTPIAPGEPLPSPDIVRKGLEEDQCDCPYALPPAHTYFRLDLRNREMVTADPTTPSTIAWLADSLTAQIDDSTRSKWHLFTVKHTSGVEDVAAYWVVRDNRRAVAAYGFLTDLAALEKLFAVSCSREELIPPTLAAGQQTDSLVYITVSTPSGSSIYQSPVPYDTLYAATDTLGVAFGNLTIQAALRPDAAPRLLIGGLPRSRLPLVLGLLILTVGVGAATLLQFRREQQLARLRDDFVSGVSHELRTPLAQIRLFGELLDDGKLRTSEERKRSTSVINREARRLTHLVENILHFSRLRRNAAQLSLEETDLRSLIGDTTEAFTLLARARDVHLKEDVQHSVTAPADRGALNQILLNLLDNALKYGPPGQTVTVGLTMAGGNARITVEDEGPGIPKADRRNIWSPYRRLDRDANTTVGGSGIGLAVVAELTALHNGSVWVEDGRNGGARFVVELPNARVTVAFARSAVTVG